MAGSSLGPPQPLTMALRWSGPTDRHDAVNPVRDLPVVVRIGQVVKALMAVQEQGLALRGVSHEGFATSPSGRTGLPQPEWRQH